MSILISPFNTLLYRPLFNGLILIYNIIPDMGIAIIILTVLIRFIFAPLSKKAIQSQKAMADLQPKMKEVQRKYKDDKEEQGRAMLALYKEHKVNPVSGCLPLLIQFPIIIALYKVFLSGMNIEQLNTLYNFVARPQSLNVMFLGFVNLAAAGNIILALIAGGSQFIQTKMMMPAKSAKGGSDMASMMGQQMMYMMPLLTVFIAWKLPTALSLYWIVFTVFGIVQQYYVEGGFTKKNV